MRKIIINFLRNAVETIEINDYKKIVSVKVDNQKEKRS